MSRVGVTLTRTMDIEPRQHDLFGMDLGEGPLRGQLVFGFMAFALWLGVTIPLTLLTIGHVTPNLALLYIAPPAALTMFGWRRREDNPRRRAITQWLLAIRYVLRGHEPIVTLGRHNASSDSVRFRDRVAARWGDGDLLAVAVPTRLYQEHETKPAQRRGTPTIIFSPVVRTYGTRYIEAMMNAGRKRIPGRRTGSTAIPTKARETN